MDSSGKEKQRNVADLTKRVRWRYDERRVEVSGGPSREERGKRVIKEGLCGLN